MLDVHAAIALLERAWAEGVAVGAFDLGNLYEHGLIRAPGINRLAPDESRAWFWYGKGAAAGEPNCLSRFAEREDRAASHADSVAGRNSHLLVGFKYYAAAAERARIEDWPEERWRNWRHRRASLARVLARARMMEEVAVAYDRVRNQYAPPPTLWERATRTTAR